MLATGIYIRAEIDGHWVSIDIGDPELNAEQLLRWFASRNNEYILNAINNAQIAIIQEKLDNAK